MFLGKWKKIKIFIKNMMNFIFFQKKISLMMLVVFETGTKEWRKNGKLHRENDKPAVNGDPGVGTIKVE